MKKRILLLLILPIFIYGDIIKKIVSRYDDGSIYKVVYLSDGAEIAKETIDTNEDSTWEGTAINGKVKQFDDNKKLAVEWEYKDNMLDGLTTVFDDNGAELIQIHYQKGIPLPYSLESSGSAKTQTESKYIVFNLATNPCVSLRDVDSDMNYRVNDLYEKIEKELGIKREEVDNYKTTDPSIPKQLLTGKNYPGMITYKLGNKFVLKRYFVLRCSPKISEEDLNDLVKKMGKTGAKDAKVLAQTCVPGSFVFGSFQMNLTSLDDIRGTNNSIDLTDFSRNIAGINSKNLISIKYSNEEINSAIGKASFEARSALAKKTARFKNVLNIKNILSLQMDGYGYFLRENFSAEIDEKGLLAVKCISSINYKTYPRPIEKGIKVPIEETRTGDVGVEVKKCEYVGSLSKEGAKDKIPAEGSVFVIIYVELKNISKKELYSLGHRWEMTDDKGYLHKAIDYDKEIDMLKNPIQPNAVMKARIYFQLSKDCKAKILVGRRGGMPRAKSEIK